MSRHWIKFNFHDLAASLAWKRMTLAERGAYITLLAEQCLFDSLPTGLDDLALVVSCTGSNISEAGAAHAIEGTVANCFTVEDGRLVNARMAETLHDLDKQTAALSAARSAAGRAGGLKTQAKAKQNKAKPSKAKQIRQDKTRDTPLPPNRGEQVTFWGSDFVAWIKARCPKGRLGRQELSGLEDWAKEYHAKGWTVDQGVCAMGRYIRLDDNPERFPAVAQLEAHVAEIKREAHSQAQRMLLRMETAPEHPQAWIMATAKSLTHTQAQSAL